MPTTSLHLRVLGSYTLTTPFGRDTQKAIRPSSIEHRQWQREDLSAALHRYQRGRLGLLFPATQDRPHIESDWILSHLPFSSSASIHMSMQ